MATNDKFLHSDISNLVLQAYYKVYNSVGYGFDSSVYCRALERELLKLGCSFERDKVLDLSYEGEKIGECRIDLFYLGKVIIVVSTHDILLDSDLERLKSYQKQSKVPVGLLLNFGLSPEHKRKLLN